MDIALHYYCSIYDLSVTELIDDDRKDRMLLTQFAIFASIRTSIDALNPFDSRSVECIAATNY